VLLDRYSKSVFSVSSPGMHMILPLFFFAPCPPAFFSALLLVFYRLIIRLTRSLPLSLHPFLPPSPSCII
jgi:hypothetical protein